MIVSRMLTKKGADVVFLVLEPGNIAKLQLGQPIVKKLNEFLPDLGKDVEIVIGYSPDVGFVADKVMDGVPLLKAIEDSMKRKEVYVRSDDAEAVARFQG